MLIPFVSCFYDQMALYYTELKRHNDFFYVNVRKTRNPNTSHIYNINVVYIHWQKDVSW